MRAEHDLIGERQVDEACFYGIQTLRAVENFPITGVSISTYPRFIQALAYIKKAAALEILGFTKGRYDILHPLNHVNMSQSTNDVYPTSIRLTLSLKFDDLLVEMARLQNSLGQKSVGFAQILKIART
jgi:aspartate ammonia-lyase